MWGSFKNYLGQYYATNETSRPTHIEDEDVSDWVIIDKDGNEIRNTTPPTENPENKSRRLSPLPLLDISNTSSPQSSPQLSPTKIEDGWLLAPPPCFAVDCPGQIETSPLEDLLIEHPSMSVYSRVSDVLEDSDSDSNLVPFLNDTKKAIEHSELTINSIHPLNAKVFEDFVCNDIKQENLSCLKEYKEECFHKKPESAERRRPYDRPEEAAESQLENDENAEVRTFPPRVLSKVPLKMKIHQQSSKPKVSKVTAVKSEVDLKSFFDQTENAKIAQQAKWERDQFKLCPSYLNRQNRVQRYQSRNHHNQKKKSIAKPYAEKCGHSF